MWPHIQSRCPKVWDILSHRLVSQPQTKPCFPAGSEKEITGHVGRCKILSACCGRPQETNTISVSISIQTTEKTLFSLSIHLSLILSKSSCPVLMVLSVIPFTFFYSLLHISIVLIYRFWAFKAIPFSGSSNYCMQLLSKTFPPCSYPCIQPKRAAG